MVHERVIECMVAAVATSAPVREARLTPTWAFMTMAVRGMTVRRLSKRSSGRRSAVADFSSSMVAALQ